MSTPNSNKGPLVVTFTWWAIGRGEIFINKFKKYQELCEFCSQPQNAPLATCLTVIIKKGKYKCMVTTKSKHKTDAILFNKLS